MSNNLWATPKYAYNYWNKNGEIAADMCANYLNRKHPIYFNRKQNSLTFDWYDKVLEVSPDAHTVWCNPPYDKPMPWVLKAIEASEKGLTTIMLVKTDKSTKWFMEAWNYGVKVIDVMGGRIQFIEPDGTKASSNNFCSSYLVFHGGTSNITTVHIDELKGSK